MGVQVRRINELANPATDHDERHADSFLDKLHALLGPGMELGLERSESSDANPHLIARFWIDNEVWSVELPQPRGSPHEPLWSLLAALLFVAIVPLVAMVAGIRFITRPMARLAREVADRSEHLRPLDMSHAIGSELREVFLSFNGLVKTATAANEARRNMLAGVSHDLRTPLSRLRLRAEIECSKETAQALEADCDALERIISQFLAYAQGEAGISLGVHEPLAELIRHIGSAYADRGVRIEMADDAVAGIAYPDLAIWRIVTNLVDNALAHGSAPIVVVVEADPLECRIGVRDAGRGIADSEAAEAFKPFVKLRDRGAGMRAGLGHCGLGLAIVAQISAELGGRVFHRAHDGSSSAVGVILPRGYSERPSSRVLSDGSDAFAPSQTLSSVL
jgi:two-component system osmolarity sensor histidine kinase EnvZ